MASSTKNLLTALQLEVDSHLQSIRYRDIHRKRAGEIYDTLYVELCRIVLRYYECADATKSITLSIQKYNEPEKVSLTGYIKLEDGFVGIEQDVTLN